ncbi:hypothetical protein VB796_07250 [Arcicella sp. LKC2W]|nr:hypothetical protein [Arcicella sp. LKC2W]MEA5458826.1 hypothetical protein [Arcicella sp. LKC2W]
MFLIIIVFEEYVILKTTMPVQGYLSVKCVFLSVSLKNMLLD